MTVDVPPDQYVIFLSDVHLGFGSRSDDLRREKTLVQLLDHVASGCCHLFIVGDLFDYWFDYRTAIPRHHVRTLAALHRLRDAGIPITYLMGNHDFGHSTYFKEELGIVIDKGDVDATIAGKRFYISHGDGKARNDRGYLLLRSVLRNRFAQWLYRILHPDIGIGMAARTSHGSRHYTTDKDYGDEDGLRSFAMERLASGYDVVVMGHRHHAVQEQTDDGLYVNLGHWLAEPATYGRYDLQDGMRVIHINLS
jgi:UDP-2,3-diacylglucosamine hydrolase